jgi:PPM family protein phosphatase
VQATVHACTRRSAAHVTNEDRALVGSTVLESTPEVHATEVTLPVTLAVLDGLGGHAAGHVASDLAAHVLADADVPTDEHGAAGLIERADLKLHDTMRDQPERFGMGSTVAMVALQPDGAVAANVGDSCAWKLTDGSFDELTVSDRAGGSAILQCLGASDEAVAPHVRRVELAAGDRLLLASDGLTDVVPTDTIEAVLRKDPDQAVRALESLVEDAGVPDDLTIIVAELRDH